MAEQAAQTTPRQGQGQRGGRRDDRRAQVPQEPKEFDEIVINIDRVARVVKGGRRFRFKALVVVGNRKNKVGVGVAKGADVLFLNSVDGGAIFGSDLTQGWILDRDGTERRINQSSKDTLAQELFNHITIKLGYANV